MTAQEMKFPANHYPGQEQFANTPTDLKWKLKQNAFQLLGLSLSATLNTVGKGFERVGKKV
jgi:hypothetical protein